MEDAIRQVMDFKEQSYPGWNWPPAEADTAACITVGDGGALLEPEPGKMLSLEGDRVHTWNGDTIELTFIAEGSPSGVLEFGYYGGMERGMVTIDFKNQSLSFRTRDYRVEQPAASCRVDARPGVSQTLSIIKRKGSGKLVELCDIDVVWNEKRVLSLKDQYILPEIGVRMIARDQVVRLQRFTHSGTTPPLPEFLHIGGYQVLNNANMKENLDAICRGVSKAAEQGVRLLLTPETSLTGLFPKLALPYSPMEIADAERQLRAHIRDTSSAPYTIVGMPGWRQSTDGVNIRYNECRMYDPDGEVVKVMSKIHSCEDNYMHGFALNEIEIERVPATLHVCHDGLYPDTWTLPVMFGARLILHPANGGKIQPENAASFRNGAGAATSTSHAFYLHVNGGGGSYLCGPVKTGPEKAPSLIAVSDEIREDNPSAPRISEPVECLFHHNIRIHDAFGYFPQRSFRMSEEIAEKYVELYRASGGSLR